MKRRSFASFLAACSATCIAASIVAGGCGSPSDRTSFDPNLPAPGGSSATPPAGTFSPPVPPSSDNSACKLAADSKGYVGCDFRALVPFVSATAAPCFAVFLANASGTQPVKVTVSLNGATYSDTSMFARIPNGSRDVTTWAPVPAGGIPPKQVAVLFLFDGIGSTSDTGDSLTCPVPAAAHDGPGVGLEIQMPGRGTTFHVETDQPVTAYDISPFGGAKGFAPSANLLLPTSAWGTNYVAVQPPYVPRAPGAEPNDTGWIAVAAMQDFTKVDIVSPADLGSEKAQDAVTHGTKTTIVLSAGEYLKWSNYRIGDGVGDATGTILVGDKPIAVWGGDHAQNVRNSSNAMATAWMDSGIAPGFCCTDSFHQQIPPVSGLGFDYAATPYATRLLSGDEESISYRVVGVADGTTFTFDPPIAGAPASLGLGAFADFEAKGAFHVTSQDAKHPFYVAQQMTYASLNGPSRKDGDPGWSYKSYYEPALGDPDQVAVLPPAQFLKAYAFFTDPTYATTSLVITRVKGSKGFADVNVDCLGNVTGWSPVGAGGKLEFARVDLARKFQGTNGCTSGAHGASSEEPFGIAVWGVDYWASYAYPAGGSVAKLNDVVVPAVPR